MGVDINVLLNIRDEGECAVFGDESELPHDMISFYFCNGFPLAAPDMQRDRVWSYSHSWGFCAGGYSGYNHWREQLANLVGFPADWEQRKECTNLPFYELVYFSDCEGTIGPATCAKLANDFEQWSERAHAIGEYWFIRLYDDFKKAFKDAANNGAVAFH